MKRLGILLAILLTTGAVFAQTNATPIPGIPPGTTFSSSGVLAGNPTTFGVYSFTAQVCDGESPPQCVSKPFTVTIAACPLAITSVSPLPDGQVGAGYSQQITATCGDGNYTWTVTSGAQR